MRTFLKMDEYAQFLNDIQRDFEVLFPSAKAYRLENKQWNYYPPYDLAFQSWKEAAIKYSK